MDILLLLVGAFVCALGLLYAVMWFAINLEPEQSIGKVDGFGLAPILPVMAVTIFCVFYLLNNYKAVYDYPQAVWFVVLGAIIAFLAGPVIFTIAVILDISLRYIRRHQ